MKRSKLMISVLSIALLLSACQERTNKNANETMTTTDTLKTNHGVPLDNIHRSRPADTLRDSTSIGQGVPLDNLDRDKKGE
ncbi:hypothetical protein D7322_20595 [Sphingobacterium puteale]|uniref:Lipoprotein n=1 Tax=Sphingobacterium puteale TaxID=2420510 RepID=A0A420VTK0_9SPHI|nr:membrane lipoprotein lipid attachment site-containing protein [Sphingobacterium puteale]RKO69671.1 hypothetical protein D7322_20595 [Sphingobacterium puteale]